jgi:hypothetical protein
MRVVSFVHNQQHNLGRIKAIALNIVLHNLGRGKKIDFSCQQFVRVAEGALAPVSSMMRDEGI